MTAKVWFITGCSSGFGAALVREALSRGDKVIATARNASKLSDLKADGADIMSVDVTSPLPELVEKAAEAFKLYGRIDYLVNNAGYTQVGGLEELTPAETQAQFDTNVFGLLNVTRAILPYMRTTRSGVIANLSSVGAWARFAGCGLYCASKYTVTGLTESLHLELADFNIKVCVVEPGYFRSNFLNPGNALNPSNVIADYEGESAVRKGVKRLESVDGKQPGDIIKGARVMVDVLTEKTGREVPLRLYLGMDAYEGIKGKCEETLAVLEEWKGIATGTDLDEK